MLVKFNISFVAYDEYNDTVIMGEFYSKNDTPTQEEIRDAINAILRSHNWSAATVTDVLVYKA